MSEHNFFGTPVLASNIAIPEDPTGKTVRIRFEWYGPSSKESCEEYGVDPNDTRAYAYFIADQTVGFDSIARPTPIGFALIEASRALPHKKLQVRTGKDLRDVDRFDMPVTMIDGIKAAVKSLHREGFRVVIEPDLLKRCQEQDMETRQENEWVKDVGVSAEKLEQF